MPDGSGVGAQLRAYAAVPSGSTPVLKYSAPIGTGSKFNPPGVGYGRIYVGTRDGHVIGFGPSSLQLNVDKDVGTGSVRVSWTGGNAPFTLLRAEDPNFTLNPVVLVDHQSVASFDDPVLNGTTSYYYEVR
jgi:hypothetical protein